MLKKRILSALILISLFLTIFFISDPIFFLTLVFFAGLVLLNELARLLELKGLSLVMYWVFSISPIIFFYLIYITTIFSSEPNHDIFKTYMNDFVIGMSFIGAFFWSILVPFDILHKKISSNKKFKIFIGYFMISPMLLVSLFMFLQDKNFILVLFLMIWLADIGAYFCGKNFGKNKLAKNISPSKTVEGAIGGFLFNIILVIVLNQLYQFHLIALISFAILVTGLSIYGDIYQSFLKRQANVKDSGSFIPGHGGLLDRLDSFCPTLPSSFLILVFCNLFLPKIIL